MSGVVYLLECEGFYKIGITDDVRKRLSQIQTSTPFNVKLIHSIPLANAWLLEKHLHERFAKKRVRGEWFKLSSDDVNTVFACSESDLPASISMPTKIANETYYTLREVAAGVGVHYQTVRTWIGEGTLNASKIGKSYRVPEAELKRLLASHTAAAK